MTYTRSIPARAGEPTVRVMASPWIPVYPRACGGTATQGRRRWRRGGLSPRVRGNLGSLPSTWISPRSIPARAGEPDTRWVACLSIPVYPRACGGTIPGRFWYHAHQGLSPRVRGNRSIPDCMYLPSGSIPARAGEPGIVSRFSMMTRVYPRACGGTRLYRSDRGRSRGLSPRVRGNPRDERLCTSDIGSIPAPGEPGQPAAEPAQHGVYPRACGGTTSGG